MKKALLVLVFIFSISAVSVSCRDTKNEKGDIEEATEDAGNAIEDTADDVGDAMEEGVDEIKENTGNGGTDDY